jgi:hypothetical protein
VLRVAPIQFRWRMPVHLDKMPHVGDLHESTSRAPVDPHRWGFGRIPSKPLPVRSPPPVAVTGGVLGAHSSTSTCGADPWEEDEAVVEVAGDNTQSAV